ncbi:MAG TPA: arginine deiminase-related protein [Gemmatimonadaceae bacterium]
MAITHVPSPKMQDYERTFVDDQPIDLALAQREHDAYCDALRECGCDVAVLDVNSSMPDCVFVEDTALVLDEVAVMMSPGAVSRRGEPAGMEPSLAEYRKIAHIELPATIDGGDIVVSGREIYVGQSPRTNSEGIAALRETLAPYGYSVTGVPVHGCLHLKTACSALPDGRFLVNAAWIDTSSFDASRLIQVPDDEPWAGDVLVIGEQIIASDAFAETIVLLTELGWRVIPVSVSEFAKAEGGVTCLSLVFTAPTTSDA